MTPEQRAALERVVDRTLTDDEVSAIDPLLDPDNRNDIAIIAVLKHGAPRSRGKFEIGIATVLGALAPNGGAFLSALKTLGDTDPNVYWAMESIRLGTLDVCSQATIELSTALGVQHPDVADAIAALLDLGVEKEPAINLTTLSNALNAAEGRMSL